MLNRFHPFDNTNYHKLLLTLPEYDCALVLPFFKFKAFIQQIVFSLDFPHIFVIILHIVGNNLHIEFNLITLVQFYILIFVLNYS